VLKVPVAVVNRAGGAGIQGTAYVIKSKKDGYTLLAAASTALVIMPVISKEVTYDPLKDLVPIGRIASSPGVIAVKADAPFQSLDELLEYARKNPGKLKVGSGGIGNESYFNMQILCARGKVKITNVPFQSGAEATTALLGGHVDALATTITNCGPQIKGGKLRGLAISSKKRASEIPGMPTATELGYPEASLSVWFGFYAPVGVPQQVIDVLVPAVEKIFKHPDVIQRALRMDMDVEYLGPAEMARSTQSEIQLVEKVARETNLIKK
jgi:tripartite-type tricarboxylate transporter receptor subunit TctC